MDSTKEQQDHKHMTQEPGDNRLNRQIVTDENYVDRYLLGHLSESEAMAFEDFYASSPETMTELEDSALLIDGLKSDVSDSPKVTSIATHRQPTTETSSSATRIIGSPLYGMAASFVAAAALLVAGGQYLGGSSVNTRTAYSINTPIVTLSASRGGDRGITINSNGADQVGIALDLGGNAIAKSYSAKLQSASGEAILQMAGMNPDELDSLTMIIGSKTLTPGDYQIIVNPENASGSTMQFVFSIR